MGVEISGVKKNIVHVGFFYKDAVGAEREKCRGKEERLIFYFNVEIDCNNKTSLSSTTTR